MFRSHNTLSPSETIMAEGSTTLSDLEAEYSEIEPTALQPKKGTDAYCFVDTVIAISPNQRTINIVTCTSTMLCSPTEAALLPSESVTPVDLSDYREQLMISLSSARKLAASSICKAQEKYQHQYDKKAQPVPFKLGD